MAKTSVNSLAIFGGPPLFKTTRPIGQLDMPGVDQFLALLRQIFARKHLTNSGPVMLELERRLAGFHGTSHCITVANAGIGLTMLMQLFAGGRRGEVIMPAFSYRGLPHFAVWAGQTPRFCDVDRNTHGLDPKAVEEVITERTTSILGVCNSNDPGDIDGLCAVAARHNVSIFFDSVYALGASYRGKRLGASGSAEVFSTHATKLLNGFEGGYITTNDDVLAAKLVWQRNFALSGLRPDVIRDDDAVLGLNGKLNEVHAAMALLSFEQLDTIVARNFDRYRTYREALDGVSGLRLVNCDATSNFSLVLAEVTDAWPLSRDQTVALTRAEGMAINPYYSPPLHRSEHAPAGLPIPDLPVSEDLARRFLQLPVGALVSVDDIREIAGLLAFVRQNGPQIAAAFRASAGA